MSAAALPVLFQAFSLLLFWSCFCRLSCTNKANTRRSIRWTFTTLSVLSAICLLAIPMTGYQPDGLVTAVVGALALTQWVTSYYWRRGVPAPFRNDQETS